MINLGLASFIEKIDERFGKLTGTIFMLLIFAAILTFCVNYILNTFIESKDAMENSEGLEYYFAAVKRYGITLSISLVIGLIMGAFLNAYFSRVWNRMFDRLSEMEEGITQSIAKDKELLERAENKVSELETYAAAIHVKLEAAQKAEAFAKEIQDKAIEAIGQLSEHKTKMIEDDYQG